MNSNPVPPDSPDDWMEKSVDELADIYHSTLSFLVDRHSPRIVINKHYRPITPLFNDACRAQKRKAVWRQWRGSIAEPEQGVIEDRKRWIEQLRAFQKFYRQVQNIYWQMLISDISGNARKLWKHAVIGHMEEENISPVQNGIDADVFLK